jgi:hypothetical protein
MGLLDLHLETLTIQQVKDPHHLAGLVRAMRIEAQETTTP